MTGPDQRASDDDRQRVVLALERHTAAGRLTLDEYADRVDRALAARTRGQLAEVTADLPAEPDPTGPGDRVRHAAGDAAQAHAGTARQLGIAFLVALAALIVIVGLAALRR
jgi:hypothetical protein